MNGRTFALSVTLFLFGAQLLSQPSECVILTFDQDGVLPSAAGFSFHGSVAESAAFSTSGGKLHLNTIGTGAVAFYFLPNAYDPSRDFELECRVRVLQVTGPFGLDFEVSDAIFDFEFGLMETGTFLPPPGRPFLPLGTSATETHVYRISYVAGSATYQFFLDDVLTVTANIAAGGDPGMRLLFGDGTGGADSHAEIDYVRFCQPRRQLIVDVDIKPGSFPNTIQPGSKGRVPVAILGSDTFSAHDVSPATVVFAGALVTSRMNGSLNAALEDANGDGFDDLVLHFMTDDIQLSTGDTIASLTGRLYDGTPIAGQDSVRVLP